MIKNLQEILAKNQSKFTRNFEKKHPKIFKKFWAKNHPKFSTNCGHVASCTRSRALKVVWHALPVKGTSFLFFSFKNPRWTIDPKLLKISCVHSARNILTLNKMRNKSVIFRWWLLFYKTSSKQTETLKIPFASERWRNSKLPQTMHTGKLFNTKHLQIWHHKGSLGSSKCW